jgi:DNA repair exonuclease SbcCD ATPase subunit
MANKLERLGDFENNYNGTRIEIDDLNSLINIVNRETSITTNEIQLTGTPLIENTVGLAWNKYLVIYINGTKYKLALLKDL